MYVKKGAYRKNNWFLIYFGRFLVCIAINLAIFRYFEVGFANTEILEFLWVRHGYAMTLSALKRWLR